MSDARDFLRVTKNAGARHVVSGALGFVVGVSLASFVAVRIVDRTRKELEWTDSMTELTRSVRNLETHVKNLEHDYAGRK
ncbi:KLTH0G04906p [Lachancea thermotolerans CBS 6340]|uniref:KLTH0G04906p n=1 Tax=Lachancea thermotolerans (strain ATCC 56472 / CBS 6340 / NRRL Y-8284) TaxID=559295 RepID=C5DM03_LACTC|nr:KLTH0G04906p [Lachancea thermotolerans CBS 6340]CAR24814.1 KLTH0G04906p [Lachancea thermotolerans CBS 6340]